MDEEFWIVSIRLVQDPQGGHFPLSFKEFDRGGNPRYKPVSVSKLHQCRPEICTLVCEPKEVPNRTSWWHNRSQSFVRSIDQFFPSTGSAWNIADCAYAIPNSAVLVRLIPFCSKEAKAAKNDDCLLTQYTILSGPPFLHRQARAIHTRSHFPEYNTSSEPCPQVLSGTGWNAAASPCALQALYAQLPRTRPLDEQQLGGEWTCLRISVLTFSPRRRSRGIGCCVKVRRSSMRVTCSSNHHPPQGLIPEDMIRAFDFRSRRSACIWIAKNDMDSGFVLHKRYSVKISPLVEANLESADLPAQYGRNRNCTTTDLPHIVR